ncbi:MAG TPA: hypothetical protein VFO70_09215 [Chitinophagaceae bacterium]|nr:hypothetical protein [Chitinophagaceae bacterium]
MDQDEPIQQLAKEMGLTIRKDNFNLNRQLLTEKVNELLETDFQYLVSLLYRLDVSETKLKGLLKENPGTDAGIIIADLMIERQAQKIRSRSQFRQRDHDIDENEKW